MKKILVIMLILLCGCSSVDSNSSTKKEYPNYFVDETGYLYHYDHLTKKEQSMYRDIYNCMVDHRRFVDIETNDEKQLDRLFYAVLEDNPEMFYLKSYSYTFDDDNCRFQPLYEINKKQIKAYNKDVELIKENIVNETRSLNDFDKIKYIYDYVINNVKYVEDSPYNQEIISSMINKESVCSGYAKMVQYLLEAVNIDCSYISGTAYSLEDTDNPNHAWNLVELEDDYYYVDATWGDIENDGEPYILYDYLLFNSEDMLKLYSPSNDYSETVSDTNNYFKKTNAYFTSYDQSGITNCLKNNSYNNSFEIKFSSDCYRSSVDKLIDGQAIYDIASNAGYNFEEITYIDNETMNSLYIKW